MEFFTADIGWLFFAYAVGSCVGWYFATKSSYENVVEATVDSLIKSGYIKTRGTGPNMELIPWQDWCDDQTTK